MKYLLILLLLPSCVTIYVTEKPIVSKKPAATEKPTHKYCSYGSIRLSIVGLTDEQYFESFPHDCKLDTPYRNQQEPLTFPVWNIKDSK